MKNRGIVIAGMIAAAFAFQPIAAQEVADTVAYDVPADESLSTPRIKSSWQPASAPTDTLLGNQSHLVTGMPWMGYGPMGWDLHQGLNAQVGAGVCVGWGKNNPWRGASFFTDLAAMYCMPLSRDGKWNAAVGGYFSNYRLWNRQVNSLGLCAMVDYRFNDCVDVSGFIIHDFGAIGGHHAGDMPMTFLDQPRTTVGAQLGINTSEKFRLQIGLSFTRGNNPLPYYPFPIGQPGTMRPTQHSYNLFP